MDNNEPKAKPGQKTFFSGISKNVISMGLTSFLTDIAQSYLILYSRFS